MSNIVGTLGDDTLVGTTGADVMSGGAGKDRLNGGNGDDIVDGGDGNDYVYGDAGNDTLYGGLGNDAVVGDAGNDVLYGGDGNDGMFGGGNDDKLFGEAGADTLYGDGGNDLIDGGADNDKLYGGTGNDTLFGGTGDDILDGGAGNDTLIYQIGTGKDQIAGGSGFDTLELVLSGADLSLVSDDLSAFADWLDAQYAAANGNVATLSAQSTGPSFSFNSLGLVVSAIEAVRIMVDGKEVALDDILNAAPVVAAEQAIETGEDLAISGSIGATDPDGDVLSYALASGPQHGSVTLDPATGAFVYTPDANYSGADGFGVVVTDAFGKFVEQHVNVTVNAVADAPTLTVSDVSVMVGGLAINGTSAPDILYGTAGSDLIIGSDGNDIIYSEEQPDTGYAVKLDIDAALTDLDGSEMLTVQISGLPEGATLSAGREIGAGVWEVSSAELPGLTMTAPEAVDVTLSVAAIAIEGNGSTASVSASIDVHFDGVDGTGGLDILRGGGGDDLMFGGGGIDYVDYSTTGNSVIVSLVTGTATGDGNDMFSGIEGVLGSQYNDTITGDGQQNFLYAGGGDDYVDAGAGDDLISDGAGRDQIYGGTGNDVIVAAVDSSLDHFNGGYGIDIVDYSAATTTIMADLGNGIVTLGGNKDLLFNIEGVTGGSGNDTLLGSNGDDILNGGAGNDTLKGGRGYDTLAGGSGSDTFVFTQSDVKSGQNYYGFDTITDFGGGDRLDFSGLSHGNKALNLAHDVHVTDTAAGIVVSVDLGGFGGYIDVVLLEDVHGINLDDLTSGHHIIV